ncbi:L-threonylcarbamoyladenylate synthase [Brotonthovivens ammoniilytica]|uniref:Threonylcarbamoyl-AMP synthase n=1 Tax=Brotonthovivens ammoniilytica TaxID=2981725 RepID=A0ABT2TJZ6_9FIRM|nr:L-threonylcarbamoyladenylate synthase [Brotonthovivens ammoniilytica]MCU6761849.1 L-threonylcarbamoyladenylate synthase [Brotonthovivens ammoniilytica]
METLVKKIDCKNIDINLIREAAQLIRAGELVAFPTETVYGLGADALHREGAEKIYSAKGRPSDNPLIVHIAEFKALEKITAAVPQEAWKLAEKFWPGPLTMIFPKSSAVPKTTTGGMETVAVRMPDHPVALALIRESGGYIAAPSANTSGKPSPTLAEHVYLDLKGRVPLILDGGGVGIGIESTIIDLSEKVPTILRPGYITKKMISEIIGEVRDDPGLISEDAAVRPKAPGMKYKHYAPKADLTVINGPQKQVIKKINELSAEKLARGRKVGVIGTDESISCYQCTCAKSIGSRCDEDAIARHLYGILREFDDMEIDDIYSESFATPRIGQAIMNRLLKAAGHQVINV